MTRKKLKRFAELPAFSNVMLQNAKMKGGWADYFHNSNPITLELGCGKGDYAIAMAASRSDRNFVGIDRKGERLWVGAKRALEEKLSNAAFLRVRIEDIERYFASGEAAEIWITFPDPFPRKKQAKHRLTSPAFLGRYKTILAPRGLVHLKTDDEGLFQYAKEAVLAVGGTIEKEIEDLWAQENLPEELRIQTAFEKRHLKAGKKIYYLQAVLNQAFAPAP